MSAYRDGVPVPKTIFEAAATHWSVKVRCSRCTNAAVFKAARQTKQRLCRGHNRKGQHRRVLPLVPAGAINCLTLAFNLQRLTLPGRVSVLVAPPALVSDETNVRNGSSADLHPFRA